MANTLVTVNNVVYLHNVTTDAQCSLALPSEDEADVPSENGENIIVA